MSRSKVVINARKFATYSLAGAAAAAGMSETADADITYNNLGILMQDTNSSDGMGLLLRIGFGSSGSYNLDLTHQLLPSATFGPSFGFAAAGGSLGGGSLNGVSIAGIAGTFSYASNVASGQAISALTNWLSASAAGSMAFGPGYGGDQFLSAGEGFMAVRWNDGADTFYGWVRVNMNGASENSFTVVDYAFAGPGESLMTGEGVVPEPGSLAGLALGAAGLAAWRRRRERN